MRLGSCLTGHNNLKAKKFGEIPISGSLESFWTEQKGFPSHVNPPFNQGSYFDWFPFSKAV